MPALSITGIDGMPAIANAGNVLRSHTAVRLSLRTPPSVEPKDVFDWLQKELTRDAPYGATVSFTLEKAQKSWASPPLSAWLGDAMESALQSFYNKGAMVRSASAQRQKTQMRRQRRAAAGTAGRPSSAGAAD